MGLLNSKKVAKIQNLLQKPLALILNIMYLIFYLPKISINVALLLTSTVDNLSN